MSIEHIKNIKYKSDDSVYTHESRKGTAFRCGYTVLVSRDPSKLNRLIPLFSRKQFDTDKVNGEIIKIPKIEYIPLRSFALCTTHYMEKKMVKWFTKKVESQKTMGYETFRSKKVHYSFYRKLAVLEGTIQGKTYFVVISKTNNENISRSAVKRWASSGTAQTVTFEETFYCTVNIATDVEGRCYEYHSHLRNPISFDFVYN
jgi:hypothetical protein